MRSKMVVMCYVKINRLLMTAPHVEEPPSKPPSDWKCGWWYGIWTFAPICLVCAKSDDLFVATNN